MCDLKNNRNKKLSGKPSKPVTVPETIMFSVEEIAKLQRAEKKRLHQEELARKMADGTIFDELIERLASICNLPNGQSCFEKELPKYGFQRSGDTFIPIFKLVPDNNKKPKAKEDEE